ncbi:MAG: N-acetyl-gamma-glutamyl-phosphate reductase [Coriobacteriia bacterium]|nr:N-acetyl-gamma-glutamyl-phosphate reductase [Coriobacteriia bacterium]
MVRAAVIGASGYVGAETVRWLLSHPNFELVVASSEADAGKPLGALYPALLQAGSKDLVLVAHSEAMTGIDFDVAFLAVPHTAAFAIAPSLLERGIAVVDLSADFRLKDAATYEQWYEVAHTAPELLDHAVYGLPELNRLELKEKVQAWQEGMGGPAGDKHSLPPLVANPGCYPTATALACAPALKAGLHAKNAPIIVNAISGVSGAGRKATQTTHFCSASDDLCAYGATSHRHTPEIAQTLSGVAEHELKVVFTPHLAPLKRGMVSTVVLPLAKELSAAEAKAALEQAYAEAYSNEPFVSLLLFGTMPHSSSVAGTNYAQVGCAYDAHSHSLVASCAIDNLGKGAAGQAIQNANILFGFDETQGLDAVAPVV